MRVLAAAALNPVAPCPGHDGFYCWGTHFEQTQRPRKLGLNNTTQKVLRSNMMTCELYRAVLIVYWPPS